MSTEPESFLARWSRRKRTAERAKEQPAKVVAPEVPVAPLANEATDAVARAGVSGTASARDPASTPEVPLPPIESLDGLRSDYQAFFQQPVADDIRHAALKKLFADPHFNQMDMLDVYVDDYTQFEPLPAAMKLRLPSARDFLLDSERAALEAAEGPSGGAGATTETSIAAAGEDREVPVSPDAAGVKPGTNDAGAESTSALTAGANVAPSDAPSANDAEKSVDVASSSVLQGKTTARGS